MKTIATIISFIIITDISFSQNIADGKANEWQVPLRYYDSKAHLQYNITNNDSMVFICVRIPEEQFQMKVTRAGMTLYIDTTGKKKKNIGIDFPIKPSAPSTMRMEQPEGVAGAGRNRIKYVIEPALKQFSSKGFITGNGTFQLKNTEGIIATGAFDSLSILTIEYQIPVRTFYHTLSQADINKKITFSFVVNGLSMPQMDGTPGGGPSGGRGNRMPGGGPPMGGENRMQGGRPQMGDGNRPDFEEREALFQTTKSILKYNFQISK